MDIVTFFKQVRQEVAKVTWPTRKETLASTGMVLVVVAIASLFFCLIDWAMLEGIIFLGLGG